MKKVLLIDTYAFLYRAYYASQSHPLQNKDGKEVGAYMGFFSTVLYLIKEIQPTHILFASDSSSPSKRKQLYEPYKANRDKMPDDLREQIAFVKNAIEVSRIPLYKEDGLEADDILVDLASRLSRENYECVIATGDKDILQVVDDSKHISVYRPPAFGTKWTHYDEATIKEKYGFGRESIASFLSLLGDSSDNIKGVSGIGEKGAKELLQNYPTLDEVYKNIDSITNTRLKNKLVEGKEDAILSYSLVVLGDYKYSGAFNIDDAELNHIDFDALVKTLSSDGLSSLSSRFQKTLSEMNIQEIGVPDEENKTEELVYESAEVNIDEATRDFTEESKIAAFVSADKSVFSYSFDGKKAKFLHLNQNYIKIISKLISSFLSSPFNTLVSFDMKELFKLSEVEFKDVKAATYDIEVMAYLEDSENSYFTKEYLATKYLNLAIVETKKEEASLFDTEAVKPIECILSYRLLDPLKNSLEKLDLESYYETIECPITFILSTMEKAGIYLDRSELENLKAALETRLKNLESEIYESIGHEFNIASPQQLSSVLFETLGIKNGKKTKTGFSVDKEVLESLRYSHPVVEKILDYRSAAKLKSTYTDALTSLISPLDNRLHTTFLQTGTATGRFSSKNPNLQNIPVRNEEGRLVRMAFKAKDGNVLLSSDYSQIELVVLAHFSKDKELTEMFKSGEDVHRLTASKIFAKNPIDITKDERRAAKTINFGVIYGMSAFRLQKDLGVTRKEANDFLESYFSLFKGVREFIDNTIKEVKQTGFTTTILGHKRFFKNINDSNRNIREATERAAVNSVIQGSAADILKKAMIDIIRSTKESDKAKLLLNVHDELIFEVSSDTKDEFSKKVEQCMVNSVPLSVPLRVSIETATAWGEMH